MVRQRSAKLNPQEREGIVRVYMANKFVFTSTYLQIFYQRALAGEPLTKPHVQRWSSLYHQAERALNLNLGGIGVQLTTIDGSGFRLSEQDIADWRSFEIPRVFLFDVRVGLAL